jgi:carboxypeptidase PM20D1
LTQPDIDAGAFLDHLGEAVRIRTVSYEDPDRNHPGPFYEFHAFLRDTYPLTTQERCAVEAVNDLSLLITWEGAEPELDPILLMAHMDVVPVEEGTEKAWDVDPFSGAVVDGELWGRGTLDDKGPLVAIMEAVEYLLRSGFVPRRTVIIALGHDEELGGLNGAAEIATTLRDRGVRPWFVIDEGGGVADVLPLVDGRVALIKTAEKGLLNLELTASGKGGHSSMPPRSTAIGKLSQAIRRLESKPFPARTVAIEPLFEALESRLDSRLRWLLTNLRYTGPLVTRLLALRPLTAGLVRTTAAATVISGGVKSNVLPQRASAIVNFRILQGDSIASVTRRVRRIVGPDIAVEPFGRDNAEPSRRSSHESDAWNVVSASVRASFPDTVVAPWTLVAMTDARHFEDIAGDVYGFGPFTSGLDSMDRIHGTGERVRTADAEAAVSFFVQVIRNAQRSGS